MAGSHALLINKTGPIYSGNISMISGRTQSETPKGGSRTTTTGYFSDLFGGIIGSVNTDSISGYTIQAISKTERSVENTRSFSFTVYGHCPNSGWNSLMINGPSTNITLLRSNSVYFASGSTSWIWGAEAQNINLLEGESYSLSFG